MTNDDGDGREGEPIGESVPARGRPSPSGLSALGGSGSPSSTGSMVQLAALRVSGIEDALRIGRMLPGIDRQLATVRIGGIQDAPRSRRICADLACPLSSSGIQGWWSHRESSLRRVAVSYHDIVRRCISFGGPPEPPGHHRPPPEPPRHDRPPPEPPRHDRPRIVSGSAESSSLSGPRRKFRPASRLQTFACFRPRELVCQRHTALAASLACSVFARESMTELTAETT
jgi:hypothetical protein